jgi:O-antigen/teichoic acid export membrane protein
MATPPFYDASQVVPFIALSFALWGCLSVVSAPFYLRDRTKWLGSLTALSGLANLLLNYLLVPGYGMMGAATATLICYAALFLVTAFIGRRYYPITYEWSRIIKIFLAAGAVYAGSLFITNDSEIIAGVLKLFSLLGFPVLLYLFKFFKPEEIDKAREILQIAPRYFRVRYLKIG